MSTAQQQFDEVYVTSTEICKELGVNRTQLLHARRQGKLPPPIVLQGTGQCLWERSAVALYIRAWREEMRQREAKREFQAL